MKLAEKRCVPCEAGTSPLDNTAIQKYLKQLPKGWRLVETLKITKEFKFKSYPQTMAFVTRVALIAQDEGHHPDMHVYYGKVIVELTTHAIGGLSENDFILAAKIDKLG